MENQGILYQIKYHAWLRWGAWPRAIIASVAIIVTLFIAVSLLESLTGGISNYFASRANAELKQEAANLKAKIPSIKATIESLNAQEMAAIKSTIEAEKAAALARSRAALALEDLSTAQKATSKAIENFKSVKRKQGVTPAQLEKALKEAGIE